MEPAPFRPSHPTPPAPVERSTPSLRSADRAAPPRTGSPAGARLRIQVGRLVLDGFNLPPDGERQVQAAFENELGLLFDAGEFPAQLRSGGARRDLPGELSISRWTGPDDLGRQIARALFEGMQR